MLAKRMSIIGSYLQDQSIMFNCSVSGPSLFANLNLLYVYKLWTLYSMALCDCKQWKRSFPSCFVPIALFVDCTNNTKRMNFRSDLLIFSHKIELRIQSEMIMESTSNRYVDFIIISDWICNIYFDTRYILGMGKSSCHFFNA